eukprot:14474155-Ditylum_brightwellii.AAC.1
MLENINYKMGQQWEKKKTHHCDTIFEELTKFFTVMDGLLKCIDASGIPDSNNANYSKDIRKDQNHLNNVSDYSYYLK